MNELLPHWSIGKLINKINKTETLFLILMAGRSLRDSIYSDSGLQKYRNTQILS